MRFAKIVFRAAGIWGFLVLTPLYFMFDKIGEMYPPAITQPVYYYAALAVAMAWQVAFLIIASDPARYRPIMVAAMLEKFIFVISCGVLYGQGRMAASQLFGPAVDGLLGVLFVAAFIKTGNQRAE